MTARRIPFLSLAPGEDAAAVRDARSIASSRAAGSCSARKSRRSKRNSPRRAARAHAVGVGTGTDALALILRALGIGAGDEVITTPLSAAYTALAIMMAGARPVFADIDPARLTHRSRRGSSARSAPRTRAILPVHLYGQAADMAALERIAARHNLADRRGLLPGAPGDGGGRPVGTIGVAGAFSFYPTKNLGALGDGGAVVTNDRGAGRRASSGCATAARPTAIITQEPGVNSRLDEMQAAILRARLPRLRGWTGAAARAGGALPRRARAARRSTCSPERDAGPRLSSVRRQRAATRDALQAHLAARGIETLIHYPVPIPRQPALAAAQPGRRVRVAARACDECSRCRFIPRCATTTSTTSPRRARRRSRT